MSDLFSLVLKGIMKLKGMKQKKARFIEEQQINEGLQMKLIRGRVQEGMSMVDATRNVLKKLFERTSLSPIVTYKVKGWKKYK